LVPATVTLLSAELDSCEEFASLLEAEVPVGWPPGQYDRGAITYFRDRLKEDPGAVGWYSWYVLLRTSEEAGRRERRDGGNLPPVH
jgi:hypothetical protein